MMGTPGYMAPEIIVGGAAEALPGADIYALGCVAYFMLSGQTPFQGTTPMEVITKQSTHEPTSLLGANGIPDELVTLVLELMSRDPADRIPSMKELRSRLSAIKVDKSWTQDDALNWWIRNSPDVASIQYDKTLLHPKSGGL